MLDARYLHLAAKEGNVSGSPVESAHSASWIPIKKIALHKTTVRIFEIIAISVRKWI